MRQSRDAQHNCCLCSDRAFPGTLDICCTQTHRHQPSLTASYRNSKRKDNPTPQRMLEIPLNVKFSAKRTQERKLNCK